jgi:hypothetical protein
VLGNGGEVGEETPFALEVDIFGEAGSILKALRNLRYIFAQQSRELYDTAGS